MNIVLLTHMWRQARGVRDSDSAFGTTVSNSGMWFHSRAGHELPAHLLRARRIWWRKLQTACLDNQLWDWQTGEVVVVKRIVSTTNMIGSALYEPQTNRTRLSLIGAQECVEIEL